MVVDTCGWTIVSFLSIGHPAGLQVTATPIQPCATKPPLINMHCVPSRTHPDALHKSDSSALPVLGAEVTQAVSPHQHRCLSQPGDLQRVACLWDSQNQTAATNGHALPKAQHQQPRLAVGEQRLLWLVVWVSKLMNREGTLCSSWKYKLVKYLCLNGKKNLISVGRESQSLLYNGTVNTTQTNLRKIKPFNYFMSIQCVFLNINSTGQSKLAVTPWK